MNAEHDNPKSAEAGEVPASFVLPAPTIWPFALALGIMLLGAGLATNAGFAAIGLVLVLVAGTGWFKQCIPGRGEIEEPVVPPELRPRPIQPAPIEVEQLRMGMPGHRLRLPERVHPYSAGLKGGIAGGVAMAVAALLYGIVSDKHTIWYPVNLLAAMVVPMPNLEAFNFAGLLVGIFIHASASIGLGLIYAVLLPTAPWPRLHWLHLLNAGVVAPLLWSGALHGFMGVLNPAMSQHVEWRWFVASQIAYGLAAGVVIMRSEKVPVEQFEIRQEPPEPRPVETRGEGQS